MLEVGREKTALVVSGSVFIFLELIFTLEPEDVF